MAWYFAKGGSAGLSRPAISNSQGCKRRQSAPKERKAKSTQGTSDAQSIETPVCRSKPHPASRQVGVTGSGDLAQSLGLRGSRQSSISSSPRASISANTPCSAAWSGRVPLKSVSLPLVSACSPGNAPSIVSPR
jgi:hypothetical protein